MEAIHKFEAAGLGKAPFRVVGVERRVGPLVIRDKDGNDTGLTVGAPGQPMGCCQYCGQGIAECWVIRSADRREFIVGCDCVSKTGDGGLKVVVDKFKTAARHAREAERIGAVAKRLATDEALRDRLAAMPSPNERRAVERGESALDWADWFIENAGNAGKLKVCRLVEGLE